MASSNIRALWEARADQALADMDLKSNISSNQRKLGDIKPPVELHRLRLGSHSFSSKQKGRKKQSTESTDSLDDIMLR